ncbi:hypothetical protein VNO77_09240 [Canavalia gladiata]|uniref:Uncharacterized protein n=1 Tax=Canavalia gladiata TaxID=3824 RepID=A0AAN9MFQ5_CANGL
MLSLSAFNSTKILKRETYLDVELAKGCLNPLSDLSRLEFLASSLGGIFIDEYLTTLTDVFKEFVDGAFWDRASAAEGQKSYIGISSYITSLYYYHGVSCFLTIQAHKVTTHPALAELQDVAFATMDIQFTMPLQLQKGQIDHPPSQ